MEQIATGTLNLIICGIRRSGWENAMNIFYIIGVVVVVAVVLGYLGFA